MLKSFSSNRLVNRTFVRNGASFWALPSTLHVPSILLSGFWLSYQTVAWTIWPASNNSSNRCWLTGSPSDSHLSLTSISRIIPPKIDIQTLQVRDGMRWGKTGSEFISLSLPVTHLRRSLVKHVVIGRHGGHEAVSDHKPFQRFIGRLTARTLGQHQWNKEARNDRPEQPSRKRLVDHGDKQVDQ